MLHKTALFFVFLVATMAFSGVVVAAAEATNEYEISGISIHTKLNQGAIEDAVYAAFASLPSENTLIIPYYFSGDPATTRLQASFDESNLDVLAGYPLEPNSVGLLILDISSVQSQTGELTLTLSSTGETEAELILIESIETASVSDTGNETTNTTDTQETGGSGSGGGGSFNLYLLLLIFILTPVTRSSFMRV